MKLSNQVNKVGRSSPIEVPDILQLKNARVSSVGPAINILHKNKTQQQTVITLDCSKQKTNDISSGSIKTHTLSCKTQSTTQTPTLLTMHTCVEAGLGVAQ